VAPAAHSANVERHEVCVIEALQHSSGDLNGGCFDLKLIEAEKLFNE
jgi:hypothetical protein